MPDLSALNHGFHREGMLGSPHCFRAIFFCILLKMAYTFLSFVQAAFASR